MSRMGGLSAILITLQWMLPCAFVWAAPTPARSMRVLAPAWKGELASGTYLPNGSYLSSLPQVESEDGAWSARALPERTQAQMKQRYLDLTREYERKQLYRQLDLSDEQAQMSRMSEFSGVYMRSIMAYQLSEGLKKAENHSEDVRTFRSVHESVGAIAKGSTSVSVAEQMKMGTRTDLPAQRGQIWMSTPLVSGAFDVQLGKRSGFDPWSISSRGGLAAIDERYVLSVSKDLPTLDLSSSLSYGVQSTRTRTALKKALSPHVRVEVSDSRGSDPVRSGLPSGGEQKLQLEYGLQF